MPLEDLIINVYLQVSDILKLCLSGAKLRSCGVCPKLSDEEVLTMEIVGEYLGLGSDEPLWRHFKTYWHEWFPLMGSRTSFVRQSANLLHLKQAMFKMLSARLSEDKDLYLFDGFPIPVCHIRRYKFSTNALKASCAVGYCAAKDENYFGLKGHLVITHNGAIRNFELTAANVDERDVLPELVWGLSGDMIADKGLIRPSLSAQLHQQSLNLHTPLRSNMKDSRPKAFVARLMSIRRKIETVIGQMVERFRIQSIRSKNLWHLKTKIMRKLLAHNVLFSINCSCNPDFPLQFELLDQF